MKAIAFGHAVFEAVWCVGFSWTKNVGEFLMVGVEAKVEDAYVAVEHVAVAHDGFVTINGFVGFAAIDAVKRGE